MIQVVTPTICRWFMRQGKSRIGINTKTVSEALTSLSSENRKLQSYIVKDLGNLSEFVNIFVNYKDLRYLNGQNTTMKDGDTLRIPLSIASGSKKIKKTAPINTVDGRNAEITPEERIRYGRHIVIPEVGLDGQRKLKAAKVLVIGAGGLGSPASLYLAAAGVGTIGLIDFDVIDETNLHRQILYTAKDIGVSKVQTAKQRLQDANPNATVNIYEERLTSANALEIFKEYDIILDGTDNFPTRYLTNDACVILGKPNVYASIFRFEGQTTVFDAKKGPCYRCVYPKPPPPRLVPSCAEGGVLGVLPGLIGLIQATETVKLIMGKGDTLVGRLLVYDAMSMTFDELKVRKNPECPVCGPKPEITQLIDYEAFCGIQRQPDSPSVMPRQLYNEIKQGKRIMLIDVRERYEYEIVHIEGSRLIPLPELAERISELNSADDIVVYCHTGGRSSIATNFLMGKGYKKVRNLEGGVEAWAVQIEPSLPRY